MKQGFLKKIIVATMIFSALILVFSPTTRVLAVDSDDYWGGQVQKDYVNTNSGLADGGLARDPRQIAVDITKLVLGFLGIIAVAIVLFAGFKWMTAGGNEDSISEAKKMLIAAVIGLVIILSAYAIADFVIRQIVSSTTGVSVY